MKKLFFFSALFFSLTAPAQTRWKQGLKYHLNVRLDTRQKSFDAVMSLQYINHSPDTLSFIWLQVWPNAFRSDRTRYTDQLLENGKTGFYFSSKEDKGYMNRMEFRVNDILAATEDHPEYIDVIKLDLPVPLKPGDSVLISAQFHVKLPENFSGFGYSGSSFQITNWYPEPAVYDRDGWHPMSFLEQGGAYDETGDYDVEISAPAAYRIVAGSNPVSVIDSGDSLHTSRFLASQVNSFAWIADKHFIEQKDTVVLKSGKSISLAYYYKTENNLISPYVRQVKTLMQQLSTLAGDYPYVCLNLVQGPEPENQSFSGILFLDQNEIRRDWTNNLRMALARQWFQTACATNERQYPWLSQGLAQYYSWRLGELDERVSKKARFMSLEDDSLWLMAAEKEKTVQPINTPAEQLTRDNYRLMERTQAAAWFRLLADSLGQGVFDQSIRSYLNQWKFNHPVPGDLQTTFSQVSGVPMEGRFAGLDTAQQILLVRAQKPWRAAMLFTVAHSDKYNYINLAPAFGYNRYDDFMVGAITHNYNVPENNFQFLAIPLYSYSAKSLEGLARLEYNWRPGGSAFSNVIVGLNGASFASNYAKDTLGKPLYERFLKFVPYLRLDFKKRTPRSTVEKSLEFKSYLINEKNFTGFGLGHDTLIHPNATISQFRYLNQLSFVISNERTLYPYHAAIQFQQADLFYRANLDGNYFFNYPSGGGMTVRLFASKFGVWHTNVKQDLSRYEPKLIGVTGDEDYTYDQYFIGRTASDAIENSSFSNGGLPARQISMRDGGLKLRIDAYDYLSGRSGNWVSALNFSTTLPAKLAPFPLPFRIFFDVGTYSEAWKTDASTSHFLYTAGIQLSLFKNALNIYAPLIYSSDFNDALRGESFWQKLTFSLDIQNISYKKWLRKHMSHD